MSASADVLRASDLVEAVKEGINTPQPKVDRKIGHWNPDDFACEQIRGLVRRVFFLSGNRPVKQVVFSPAESHIDVSYICTQVAQALALETRSQVALVDREEGVTDITSSRPRSAIASIQSRSTQMAVNLWRVPRIKLGECSKDSGMGIYWLSCLAELRNEFEYAVIQGPAAGTSSEAALLGQLTDGIILVLGANRTRRATALKIKESLEGTQSRILGTVLSERTFPIPERIYRHL
jgi:hypothetical protein